MYSPAIPFLWYFDELKCYVLKILIKKKKKQPTNPKNQSPPKKQRDNAEISVTVIYNLSSNITDEHFAVKNQTLFHHFAHTHSSCDQKDGFPFCLFCFVWIWFFNSITVKDGQNCLLKGGTEIILHRISFLGMLSSVDQIVKKAQNSVKFQSAFHDQI